ncbi:hypothetical protein Tco_0543392 [Tanacetum coccineum]
MVVQEQAEMGKGLANRTDLHHTPTIIQPSPKPQKKQKPRNPKRNDTQIPQSSGPTEHVADEAVYKELDDSLVRSATTSSSLEAEQDSGYIIKTLMKLVPKELLQTTKTTQANEIDSLKRRVKRLEKKKRSTTHRLKILYKIGLSARIESFRDEEDLGEDASEQERINAIDIDEDITLVNDQDDVDMFDVNTLTGDEVLAESKVVVKDVNLSVDEVTLAQALAALKSEKDSSATTTTAIIPTPRKGIVFQESGTTTTTTISSQQPSQENVQDKVKGKMVEPGKPVKKKELIRLDKKIASKLQAEFDKEVRLAREKAEKEQEANVALIEECDDIQAKIKVDHELAQRLQAQEQEELSDAEKDTLFV